MSTNLVTILTHHSLLSGGIASKLGELSSSLRISIVDTELDNVQQALTTDQPGYIILDASDTGICQSYPIPKLLEWAPKAKVIRLDMTSDIVRIFSSQEFHVRQTTDLFHIIQTLSGKNTAL